MALTDIQIKRAKPQDKPYTLNDGQGLSLLINPDGSKGWRFRFRFAGKTGRAAYNPAPDLAIALVVPKQKHHPFLSDAPRGEQCTVHYSLTHHYLSR